MAVPNAVEAPDATVPAADNRYGAPKYAAAAMPTTRKTLRSFLLLMIATVLPPGKHENEPEKNQPAEKNQRKALH
jgi:hypothetical protein